LLLLLCLWRQRAFSPFSTWDFSTQTFSSPPRTGLGFVVDALSSGLPLSPLLSSSFTLFFTGLYSAKGTLGAGAMSHARPRAERFLLGRRAGLARCGMCAVPRTHSPFLFFCLRCAQSFEEPFSPQRARPERLGCFSLSLDLVAFFLKPCLPLFFLFSSRPHFRQEPRRCRSFAHNTNSRLSRAFLL